MSLNPSVPSKCRCYAAKSSGAPLEPYEITRRAVHERDVLISIKFAGICHSDIHQAKEEWGSAIFPMVPGHEIVGHVVAAGSAVTKFSVGDVVGVGCMVDSCRQCSNCAAGLEQYCRTGSVFTYNSTYSYPHCVEFNETGGAPTYGGYSQSIVVDEDFVLKVPSNLDLAAAAPLLCAGITTYSPLVHYGLKAGMKLAVVGLGGLGHMAVKFGVAMGAETYVVSRGVAKKEQALRGLHATGFIDSSNDQEMNDGKETFDMILDTVAAKHDIGPYLELLKLDGKMIVVGVPPEPVPLHFGSLIFHRRCIAGSLIGGVRETQEMLDFCGKHDIVCDIEKIDASYVNEAYDRVIRGDVCYRFVIDAATF